MSLTTNWVVDLETLSNCFIACIEHYKTDERKVFIVYELRNDLEEFINFLDQNQKHDHWHITFNGLAFDSQIIQWIRDNKKTLLSLSGKEAAIKIYEYAQKVIDISTQIRNGIRGVYYDYNPSYFKIKQIDIFKLLHYDSKAKSTSLKFLQFSMDWRNLEEMPIHHSTEITTWDQINTIVSYCWNDVASTKQVMTLAKEQIMLRVALSQEFNLNLYSASEPRISKEIFAHFLCKKLDISNKELKSLKTFRKSIKIKDCILPYVQFKTPYFKKLLEFFESKTITETKGALDYKVTYKGIDIYYGTGGVHAARNPGIYEAKNGMIIMSSDVVSFYPMLAIQNGFCPAHFPKEEFLGQYKWFFDERKKIPKSNPKNYVWKICLNSAYGLSNDINSYFYDPMMTMQITVNGQLLLSMLTEMVLEAIPESYIIIKNTDGVEVMIPANKKDKYLEICKEWEELTRLTLEHDQYKKIILSDVNNYIAINNIGKAKCKGRFEWEDQDAKKAGTLHKNKSFLVIPKAIYQYFVNGIKPEDYLESNTNIFDYCGAVKAKSGWHYEEHYLVKGEHQKTILNKIVRYYVSTVGTKLIKINDNDGRVSQVEAGKWKTTVANNMDLLPKDFKDLNIDYNYYLTNIYKEIHNINTTIHRGQIQLDLFGQ